MAERTEKKTGGKYIPSLQALRGIAFLGVFLRHSGVLTRGAMTISVFFILSGFLTAYHSSGGRPLDCSLTGCLRFSLRRIRKLYPLYMLTLLFLLALLLRSMRLDALPGTSMRDVAVTFGLHAVLLQAWAPFRSIYFAFNTSAWFLSVLMFFYAVSPPALTALRRLSVRGLLRAMLIICAVYCAYSFAAALTADRWIPSYAREWFLYIAPPYRLGDYLIGCCLGFLFPSCASVPIPRRRAAAAEAAVLALAVMTFVIYTLDVGFLCRLGLEKTVLPLPAAAMLVFLTALDRGGVLSVLNNRLTRFFGGISASAFLIHWPVLTACKRLFAHVGLPTDGSPGYIGTCFALTILLSLAWNALQARIHTTGVKKTT